MKCALVASVLAAVLALEDAAPPSISLSLQSNAGANAGPAMQYKNHYANIARTHFGHAKTCTQFADITKGTCNTWNTMSYVQTQKSYAERCNVLDDSAATCKPPVAAIHDHHDGNSLKIRTTTKLFLSMPKQGTAVVRTDKVVGTNFELGNAKYTPKGLNYNVRGEYLISYDAQDRAGNAADQLTYAMIMQDYKAPTVSNVNVPVSLESCDHDTVAASFKTADRSNWALPPTATLVDNYDGTVSSGKDAAHFFFDYKLPGQSKWTGPISKSTKYEITQRPSTLGDMKVRFTAIDYANIFGNGYKSNKFTSEYTIKVEDTTAPKCYQAPAHNGHKLNKINGKFCGSLIKSVNSANPSAAGGRAACFNQQLDRMTGTKQITTANRCAGYQITKSGYNLYSTGSSTTCDRILQKSVVSECGVAYTETGAKCADIRGSWKVGGGVDRNALKATLGGNLMTGSDNFQHVGDYVTSYSTVNNGQSARVVRKVQVRDTTKPVLSITTLGIESLLHKKGLLMNAAGQRVYKVAFNAAKSTCETNSVSKKVWCKVMKHADKYTSESHVIQHSAGYVADMNYIRHLVKPYMGMTCMDSCTGDLTNNVVTTWHQNKCAGASLNKFDTLVPGTYALKYTCTDASKNSISKCRTVVNVDHKKPVLTVLEADSQTYEATRSDNYIDAGATCSDEVDKDISQDVEVSGDVVNLARVAVYKVLYNCQDSAGNKAVQATRTVTVQDTTCPQCIMKKTSGVASFAETIEGSFPYTDAGAIASDSLQGTFGVCSTWSAGTKQFYKSIVNTEKTGTYLVTYRVKDSAGNWNDGLKCKRAKGVAINSIRTVTVVDTLAPVIALSFKSKFIHHGDSSQVSKGMRHSVTNGKVRAHTVTNPAGAWIKKNWFMAESNESSPLNAWVLGAVASGISGLALLGYAMKKQPTVTTVPV